MLIILKADTSGIIQYQCHPLSPAKPQLPNSQDFKLKFWYEHGSANTTEEKLPRIHHAAIISEMDLEHVAQAHLGPRYPWWMLEHVLSELIKFNAGISEASIPKMWWS